MRGWWWRWWRRPVGGHVVLYHRAGCHLCDEAWELLSRARRRYGFTLEVVDIDADPALVAAHGEHVPVIAVNGTVRFRGVVNAVLLRRLFEHGPRQS
jgi:glutaredoxin